jgi:hypothetical protein
MKDELVTNWSWKWFGFWRGAKERSGNIPAVEDFVDEAWRPPDKEPILQYLEHTPVILVASAGHHECLLCPEPLLSASYHSDGIWLWPTSLAHYARQHSVRLPSPFESWIRGKQCHPPEKVNVRLDQLPWPNETK